MAAARGRSMGSLGRAGSGSNGPTEASLRDELKKLLCAPEVRTTDIADLAEPQQRPSIGYSTGTSSSRPPAAASSLSGGGYSKNSTSKNSLPILEIKDSSQQALAPRSKISGFDGLKGSGGSMKSLLTAAHRFADPRNLPSAGDRQSGVRSVQQSERGSERGSATKAELSQPSSQMRCPPRAPTSSPAPESLVVSTVKPQKAKKEKERTWSVKEECAKLNNELERLGKPVRKMNWASPDIENVYLRKEVTSQLLKTLVQTEKKLGSMDLNDSDDVSTNAPSSGKDSGRGNHYILSR